MSDVEKAISGLVEDEELLQNQQQQQQQQLQHNPQQYQQHQQQSTPLNKIIANNYNLQNETGNNKQLLQKHQQQHQHNQQSEHLHPHAHTLQQQHSNFQQDNSKNYLTPQQEQQQQQHQQSEEEQQQQYQQQEHTCLSRLFKLIFSTPGLVVMVVVYTIMGAFIFPLLEAPQDISKSALIAKSREECLKELWIITEKLNVLYERNWTMLVHEQLRRFEGTIVAATRNMAAGASANGASSGGATGGYGGMATETTTTALGRYGVGAGNNNNNFLEYSDLTATRWSFSEALLYSVTVITTIGHGSLTPRTAGGKIATIFYALIGVPLMLMCLSSLGALLAEALQCTYARLCCRRWPHYIQDDGGGGGGDDSEDDIKHTKHKHIPSHSERIKRHLTAELNVEKHGHQHLHHEVKQRLQHSCDFQEHKNQINCKNCKYDAIIGESNTNHDGYDYKMCNDATTTTKTASTLSSSSSAPGVATTTTAAMTTMKLGHKEDCCQLLHNSPGKITQHLSSCMQLKMSPTMSGSGGNNNTTTNTISLQQQQYYQQRPDVMLMTTGHKLSSQQPITTATTTVAGATAIPTMPTTACRMILPPSQTQTRFYGNNPTAPLATYHIVSSASANSSPTHHQSIRHYIVPQMPPAPTQTQLMASSSSAAPVTQHFMAVPSSMLRFHQTSPQTSIQLQQQQHQQPSGVNTTTSNININPLALPVSGSATVYFPIVTPAINSSQNSSLGPVTQPLVKYHTIQMPHKRQHTLTLVQQTDLEDNHDATLFPPPPPPAYQTATVHGIRRAKFLTKPLPQEINTLMHESDISCRHDLSQNSGAELAQQHSTNVYSPTSTASALLSNEAGMETETSMSSAATTTAGNNFYFGSQTSTITASSISPASTATLTNNTTTIYENHESTATLSQQQQQQQQQQPTHITNSQINVGLTSGDELGGYVSAAGLATSANVDIMEDEEEQEQQRLGNCPHGTPSRVPLLTNSSSNSEDKSHARSFLNATAASFHRHTLNTFQRSSNSMAQQRKSVIINRKGECNLHIPKRRNSSAASICYGDHYEDTSDDDLGGLEGSNIYKLKHLHPSHAVTDKLHSQEDFCDNHSLVSLSDSANSQIPQVPIIVVLFILIFYVCLGTVIFALWENWSLIDGAYFCFVTLTTIGYGDFVPLKTFQGPEIQLFACCAYLLLGLVLVAMSFSILETQLIWKCKRLAVRLKLAKE